MWPQNLSPVIEFLEEASHSHTHKTNYLKTILDWLIIIPTIFNSILLIKVVTGWLKRKMNVTFDEAVATSHCSIAHAMRLLRDSIQVFSSNTSLDFICAVNLKKFDVTCEAIIYDYFRFLFENNNEIFQLISLHST